MTAFADRFLKFVFDGMILFLVQAKALVCKAIGDSTPTINEMNTLVDRQGKLLIVFDAKILLFVDIFLNFLVNGFSN